MFNLFKEISKENKIGDVVIHNDVARFTIEVDTGDIRPDILNAFKTVSKIIDSDILLKVLLTQVYSAQHGEECSEVNQLLETGYIHLFGVEKDD